MDLQPSEIVSKKKVGHIGSDAVWDIRTIGGLNMHVLVHNGRVEPLGLGPHPAVSRHLAKKRRPDIVWTELAKSDDQVDPGSPLVARYEAVTAHARRVAGY